ncbi:MAG TPA: polysaccharide pyruvyl transferase family protein [Sphingomonas sp.]|jgi:polysaccharide pyruvyl transferase WcaK-like protein
MNDPLFTRRGAMVGGAALAAAIATNARAATGRPRRILLRSGWQIENIGDVAHTPGMLRLIEQHLPGTEVTFWPWYDELPGQEREMLMRRFPRLKIAQGKLVDGRATTPELAKAVAGADFLLHNSGPYALAWKDLDAFAGMTGKPFGVYGVTYGHWIFGNEERDTLSRARFAYFRDRVSLRKARLDGVAAKVTDFAPDAAFMTDIVDARAGDALIRRFGLQPGRFFVCLPKHRYTPSWLHVRKNRPIDRRMEQRNNEMGELDHTPLREAIIRLVREAGRQVLIGNEDETEVAIGKTWLLDRLPEDVKPRVHWLDRPWRMDEALGVYRRSEALFGHEMHSPIMCIGMGVPALVGRWVEQSSKGTMWDDIGVPEWLFNMDSEADVRRLPQTVLDVARNPASSRARAEAARQRVLARFSQTMTAVADASRAAGA